MKTKKKILSAIFGSAILSGCLTLGVFSSSPTELNAAEAPVYTVTDGTAADANGSISFNKTTANEGDPIRVEVSPQYGFELKSLYYEIDASAWSVIGNFNDTNWATDIPMVEVSSNVFVSRVLTFEENVEFKVRKNADWAENYGASSKENPTHVNAGSGTAVIQDGSNITVDAAGSYVVTLDVNNLTITVNSATTSLAEKIEIAGDSSNLYFFSMPASNVKVTAEFERIHTVMEVLNTVSGGFPTFSMPLPSNVWENRNCTTSKLYKNLSEGLTFGSLDTFDSFDHILNSPLTKVENGYELIKDPCTIKFEMISNELVSITLSGSAHAEINGVYAPHMHVMDHHSAVAPTCTEDGTLEYWTCPNESGVYFANAEGTETLSSIVASKLGHDMVHHEAVAPTCTKDGNIEYWTCSHESGVYYENEERTSTLSSIVDSKLGHDMEHHEAVAPTCTEDGTVEYWTCSRESGVYFANEEGTATFDSIVDPKIGHHYSGEVLYTWNNNKCTASWHCDHDGCEEVESETVTGVYVKDSDATTESNEKGHYKATFTNANFAKQVTAANSVEKEGTKLLPEPVEEKGLSTGAIVGIVVGSVVLAVLVAYIAMFFVWKKNEKALKFLIPSFKWINKTIFKK